MASNRTVAGFLVCAVLGSGATGALAQPFGFIVNAGDPTNDGTHDNLWRVNLATGSADRIGPLNLTAPGSTAIQSDVEGLALETATFLYGVNDASKSLVTISTSQGIATTLDRPIDNLRLGTSGELDPGLAFDCQGRLLMVSPTRRSLYRLDKLTGQATVIGAEGRLGVRIADIAVRGDEAFGIGIAGDEGLYRIDTANGTASLVGRFASDIVLANAGMDFDSAGNLWGVGHIVDGQGQPQPSRILRIDRAAGTATAGPTTRTGVKGLAITPTRCDVSGTPPPAPPVGVPVASWPALLLLVLALLAAGLRRRPA